MANALIERLFADVRKVEPLDRQSGYTRKFSDGSRAKFDLPVSPASNRADDIVKAASEGGATSRLSQPVENGHGMLQEKRTYGPVSAGKVIHEFLTRDVDNPEPAPGKGK